MFSPPRFSILTFSVPPKLLTGIHVINFAVNHLHDHNRQHHIETDGQTDGQTTHDDNSVLYTCALHAIDAVEAPCRSQ